MSGYLYLHLQSLLKKPRLASKCPVPALRIKKKPRDRNEGKTPISCVFHEQQQKKKVGEYTQSKGTPEKSIVSSCPLCPTLHQTRSPARRKRKRKRKKTPRPFT
jgi:hypothetical protein